MKNLIFVIFSFLACPVYAWECNGYNHGQETNFDTHIELASEIILARVISASISGAYSINFDVEVAHFFKGNKNLLLSLETTTDNLDPEISIGYYYIFFLYGENTVDFCGISLKLMPHINTSKKLLSYVETDDYFTPYKNKMLLKVLSLNSEEP